MSYTKERDQFIVNATRAGLVFDTTTALLRYATTLQRLAEAQCNGDWPADNGERKVKACPKCESLWVPSTIKAGGCPDCRTSALAVKALVGTGYRPVFGGDPRGAVLTIVPVGALDVDVQSGRECGIYVPAR